MLQALFISLYKSFVNVLTERLPPVSPEGELPDLRAGNVSSMTIDLEESATMDVDNENGTKDDRQVHCCYHLSLYLFFPHTTPPLPSCLCIGL